jgi:putative DNA primase/helicase
MENGHVTQFAEALRAAGIILKGDPVFDDRIHRVDVEGKPGGRDGSYRVKTEGDRAYGWFQNWTMHTEPQPWHANGDHRLTREQRRHFEQERATQNATREKALHEQHDRAAAEYQALWDGAVPVETHPYLTRKGVLSYGLRQGAPGQTMTITDDDGAPRTIDLAGRLFVPMRDVQGKQWSLQYISDDGRKRYHPGGRKECCHHLIRSDGGSPHLFIAEGYSTGASVHEISGKCPVAVAFDAGNLLAVAHARQALRPEAPPVIVGDNDHQRERENGPEGKPKPNTGKIAAGAAAEAVGGIAVLPQFSAEEPELSDWNDKVAAVGINETSVQFWRALARAARTRREIVER